MDDRKTFHFKASTERAAKIEALMKKDDERTFQRWMERLLDRLFDRMKKQQKEQAQ